jgi:hypothetical protein
MLSLLMQTQQLDYRRLLRYLNRYAKRNSSNPQAYNQHNRYNGLTRKAL